MKFNPDISNKKTLMKGLLTEVWIELKEQKRTMKHPELRRDGWKPSSCRDKERRQWLWSPSSELDLGIVTFESFSACQTQREIT